MEQFMKPFIIELPGETVVMWVPIWWPTTYFKSSWEDPAVQAAYARSEENKAADATANLFTSAVEQRPCYEPSYQFKPELPTGHIVNMIYDAGPKSRALNA